MNVDSDTDNDNRNDNYIKNDNKNVFDKNIKMKLKQPPKALSTPKWFKP